MGNAHPNSITHPAHPGHTLRKTKLTSAFTCNGCNERGDGKRYECESCYYNLHMCCACLEDNHLEHPEFKGCTLTFRQKPPRPTGFSCDACGDGIIGFHFQNRERNVDLHPLCAFSPVSIEHDGVEFSLYRRASGMCILCRQSGRRDSFWSYKSEDGEGGEPVYMHLSCLKQGGTGVQVGQSSALTVTGQGMQLQTVSASRSRWLIRVWNFAKIFGKIAYALATFDPVAIASLGSDVYQALTS